MTGANGFIGSAMVWELNRNGHDSILTCDTVTPKARPEILSQLRFREFISADALLTSLDKLDKLDAIFHMGACSYTTEMNVEYLRRNNTEYTQRLFEFCAKKNIPFIYASSGATYGDGKLGFDDNTPSQNFKPLNPYGWSKLNFDVWALQQSKTPSRWYGLRFFNVYGPNEYHKGEQRSVVHKAFVQITETGKLKLFRSHHKDYADGKQLRDFIYVKDVVRWMWELFENKNVQSGIYNMGYGQARTWLDLAHGVFANLKKDAKIDWIDIPVNLREQYQYFTEARMQKWFSQGLSRPEWTLEAGISDYVKNYLLTDNPFLRP